MPITTIAPTTPPPQASTAKPEPCRDRDGNVKQASTVKDLFFYIAILDINYKVLRPYKLKFVYLCFAS